MVRFSKNRLYSCVFTAAIFSFLSGIDVEARSHSFVSLSCGEGKLPYRCSDGASHTISDKVYQFVKSTEEKNGSEASLISSTIIVAQQPNTVIQANRVQINGVDGAGATDNTYGVVASQGGKVVLSDSTLKDISTGLRAESGTIEVNRGLVKATQVGVYADKQGTSVLLTNTKIKVKSRDFNQGVALFNGADAVIKMKGGSIDVTDAAALYVRVRGSTTLNDVTITSKSQQAIDKGNANKEDDVSYAVLNVNQHSSLSLNNTNIVATGVHALWIGLEANAQSSVGQEASILISRVNIEDSKITVSGTKHGMHFDMDKEDNEYQQGFIFLKRTTFDVPDGAVIHSYRGSSYIGVTEGTKISGDLLLTAEKESSVAILANSSSLTGGTRVADDSVAELYLTGGSKWVLTKSKEMNQQVSNLVSSISFVKLSDSMIAFSPPAFQEYQTLYIGKGEEEVYSAQGNAHLYLNTFLKGDGSLDNQKTDRLLIHGDVVGKTTVHVQFIAGNQAEAVGNGNAESISLIQVSGKAAEDSFQLSSSYIALEGLPYQYYLYAYGPSSSLGKAKTSQRLVKGNGNFWDFRLESKYVQLTPNVSTVPDSELMVRDVVPQVPTYLFLPNALFHAGLMDIENKNKQLKIMRSVSSKLLKFERIPTLSVYDYGGNYHYVSDLSLLEYGYGGHLHYNALEADILLKTIERAHITTSFGILTTYGKLSLRPQGVEHSQKNIFHKWSVTAYGNLESSVGFYVDSLLTYGLFKGDVLTFARNKTATLKGNPLNVSLSVGKAFTTGGKAFVFDPQIQLIYQHLQFHKAHDIDGFDVEMGKLDQWGMRIGGRLTKTLAASEKDRIVSFYGKIHLSHSFRGKRSVYFKDAFQLSAFGSSLEAGVGVHSQLSPKFTLHGDLMYQHKLTKAGFSGIHFSGGLRYRF
ncbi:autotransporter outer membrane beta-barrel domain-containing protein [Bartonella koehlerae]|uniref:Outer membrane autotransporter barrel domain-containing protein n=1 Tax=Bartonella koehlerae C-29 TaxID=1134510 RepID=A0A067WI52_9HYPH|nr:autotransporter outer membrane beta-barrel domain-containing protein [Bartonella koehlerae]KEC55592.1 outer membrane autotransporter barrel domain-containing protein [Bartonella koehlerae C-29]